MTFCCTKILCDNLESALGNLLIQEYQSADNTIENIVAADPGITGMLDRWSIDINNENKAFRQVFLHTQMDPQSITLKDVNYVKNLLANVYQKKYNEPITAASITTVPQMR